MRLHQNHCSCRFCALAYAWPYIRLEHQEKTSRIESIGSSPYYSAFQPRRRNVRQLLISSPNHKDPCHNFQVNVDERKQSIVRDGADKVDEIVYHTDYHGVTTHPNPTPKHPTP
ncbi:hypothetical protein ACOSQ4_015751 [Xanthoceras sorbifolium]